MATFHSRSNSLPSKSHTTMDDVENLISRQKSSDATSTSSISSLCSNLANLIDLHEGFNSMIQMPSVQQAISNEKGETWISELLEGSLGLVDLCGFSRDIIYSTKESVQELASSIRRGSRGETSTADDINAFVASRKKIAKKVNKILKNFNQNSAALQIKDDSDLKSVATTLREVQALDFSILKSVVMLLSGDKENSKKRSWSLLSKFTHSSRVHSQENRSEEELCFFNIDKYSIKNMDSLNMLKQLKSSEMTIQEIEEGLEVLFRSLVQTRVSLLNLLSH